MGRLSVLASRVALIAGAGGAGAGVVINEFLPDPEGADAGKEFVELLNTGPGPVDLLDVALDFANGIDGPVWTTRWRCSESLVLPEGGRLLIVDRNWLGEPAGHIEVWLGLQNGPDAIRLARGGQVLDLVGYGALTDPLLMEGAPARLTPGLAVARRPDGADTDDNARDFTPHTPTPGMANFLPFDLQLMEVEFDPPSTDRSGVRLAVTATVRNTGTEPLPAAPLALVGLGQPAGTLLDALSPDEERTLTWYVVPQGAGALAARLVLAPPGADTLMVPLGTYQVGPAALFLNEVAAAPAAGQGEWVEIGCLGPGPQDLAAWRLREEDGGWLPLPGFLLMPGDLVVLAQDPAALGGWQLANETAGGEGDCGSAELLSRLLQPVGAWPTLNNSPPADRLFADRVYLGDTNGTVLDHVTLGTPETLDLLASGRSWERIAPRPANPAAGNWAPCTSPMGGTPACGNSVTAAAGAAGGLEVTPELLDPLAGSSTQHLRFLVEAPAEGWWLRIFNSWGETVRDLGGDQQGPGPRDLIWDGRNEAGLPVPQGAYIVLLELRGPAGKVLRRIPALSVVRRRSGS